MISQNIGKKALAGLGVGISGWLLFNKLNKKGQDGMSPLQNVANSLSNCPQKPLKIPAEQPKGQKQEKFIEELHQDNNSKEKRIEEDSPEQLPIMRVARLQGNDEEKKENVAEKGHDALSREQPAENERKTSVQSYQTGSQSASECRRYLTCHLLGKQMVQPAPVLCCRIQFERQALQAYIGKNKRCPRCKKDIQRGDFVVRKNFEKLSAYLRNRKSKNKTQNQVSKGNGIATFSILASKVEEQQVAAQRSADK